jgi:lipid II:glycine glycyltransferase (peptidoglycan interpeptide bridge formation enzyme)
LLQTSAWGELKSRFGWKIEQVIEGDVGAQILFRQLPIGGSIAYIPKGPIGPWLPGLLPALDQACHARNTVLLKVEPDAFRDDTLASELSDAGFRPSAHSIQPGSTIVVGLSGKEDDLLARMSQKTRYNIRLAYRKGVSVRPWADLDVFGRMMSETAERDQFGAHTVDYYKTAYELFHPAGECELLVAEAENTPLASLMVFAHGPRSWYLYGASTSKMRNRMPTYALQWEAMRWAKSHGCETYDLWGVPEEEIETLESEFAGRSDGLWGVYRFKRGFGGELARSAGTWDRPYRTLPYLAYRLASRLLNLA